MPSVNDLTKSKYLKGDDVKPPKLFTISGYDLVELDKDGGQKEKRYALTFRESEKPLVLNKTNGVIIAKICGSDDFDGWIGKKIVVYFDENVGFGGKLTGGIRVRAPKQAVPAAKPKPAPVVEEEPPINEDDIPFGADLDDPNNY